MLFDLHYLHKSGSLHSLRSHNASPQMLGICYFCVREIMFGIDPISRTSEMGVVRFMGDTFRM